MPEEPSESSRKSWKSSGAFNVPKRRLSLWPSVRDLLLLEYCKAQIRSLRRVISLTRSCIQQEVTPGKQMQDSDGERQLFRQYLSQGGVCVLT